MVDHTSITIQVGAERDEVQQPQRPHQQQQEWLDSARKFHVFFGMLQLLIITREVTGPASSNWVYWCLDVGSRTLGFELLLWTNLSPVTSLVINLSLLVYALESSSLLTRGSNQLLRFIQLLNEASFAEVQFDI